MRSATMYECEDCGERRNGPLQSLECPACGCPTHYVLIDGTALT